MAKIKKILIINPFGIGDVLFTTPLIRNIKYNLPDSVIGFVCNQRAVPLFSNSPFISKVFVFEKDYFRQLYKASKIKCLRELMAFLNSIRKMKFDYAIDLSLGSRTAFYLWLAGIKNRYGFNYKNRGRFLTQKINIEGYSDKHIVEYYLELLKFFKFEVKDNYLQIFSGEDSLAWADEFLRLEGIKKDDFVIGIIPGGGASWGKKAAVKHWPAQRYAQICDKCIEKFKAKIIIFGDYSDAIACNRVYEVVKARAIQLCGKTDLNQFAALLKRCNLVITNDGGPLHLAVAAGAKTVSLFGPVDEKVYGPFPFDPKRHRVVKKELDCRPCYKKFKLDDCVKRNCLEDINSADVLKAIEELI